MAILSITEEWEGLTGGDDLSSITHKRQFRVVFDNADLPENRPLIAFAGQADPLGRTLPAEFSSHSFNPWLIVVRRSYTARSPFVFDFEIEYSNRSTYSDSDSARENFTNPLDQPWDIEWFTGTTSERLDQDVYGGPIENANREPADPPLQEEFAYEGVRVRKALEYWPHNMMAQYANAVNSDYFWGYPPGTALCTQVGARRMRQGWFFYWDANFEILFRLDHWDRVVRHEGYTVRITDSDGTRFALAKVNPKNDGKEGVGEITPEPVLLDTFGYRLPKGELFRKLVFATKQQLPFYNLGLG
jgi:hypothetical protein